MDIHKPKTWHGLREMTRPAAGLHHHKAGRMGCKERQQPTSTELLAEHNSARSIRPMRLKTDLGDV